MADHKFIFGGADSSTYGIYISGEGVFNAPERAVEMISIPGRNGAIALDQGRFENIEVTYPAFNYEQGMSDFSSNLAGLRSALCSKRGYQRLTDTIHPDEFRLGVYRSGLEVTPVKYNTASDFNIMFDCKPQRFLTSGEAEVDGNAWSNVQTGSGSIVTIDNADGDIGFKSLVADIEPIQSGSGTPSPTNVRPISGWDKVKVAKTGKNLLDSSLCVERTAYGTTTTVNIDGSISLVGTTTGVNRWWSPNDSLSIPLKAGTYTASPNNMGISTTTAGIKTGTFTLTEDTVINNARFVLANGQTYNEVIYPQLEAGSSATAYEPFGDTYTTALGRTVYKGTLDVVSGLLTVTHLAVDMGTLSWTAMAGQGGSIYYMRTTDLASTIYRVSSSDVVADLYSDAYVAKKNNTIYAGVVGVASTASGYVTVYDDRYNTASSASAFKTAVTGQTLVYPLATPQTYQLTPEEVDLLLGTNNIWADSGDITVQYGKSPVYNPTEFDARPLIKVVGIGTTVVGDTAITITGTAGQTIYIDCDSMEIYKLNGGTPQSAASLVSFSGNDFPTLKAGSNTVALGTGITSVTIIPRWWII